MTKFNVACLQICSGANIEENLIKIEPMIREAKAKGADFIALPENTDFKASDCAKLFAAARHENEHIALPFFKRLAEELDLWILAGSLVAMKTEHEKLANRSYMFAPQGNIAATYDKIHMFDADLSASECYRESNSFRGGTKAVTVQTPWGTMGLSICYDLRFPHLFRALAKAGAQVLNIPAAFTVPTGKMHWHTLLRARAIETGCFVIAPGQCGTHDGGRKTYGHSLVVAPTGEIIAEAADDPAIIIAEIDMDRVTAARQMLPSLQHDRAFVGP